MIALTLLLFSGTKIPIEIDQKMLSSIEFSDEIDEFTVNDLVDYLYRYWNDVFDGVSDISTPTYISQIQLLHLGARLQPELKISSLNLAVSPVIHLILKPVEMVRAYSDTASASRKGLLKKFMGNTAIGLQRGVNQEPIYTRRPSDTGPPLAAIARKDTGNASVNNEERNTISSSTNGGGLLISSPGDFETSSTEGSRNFVSATDNIALEDLSNSARRSTTNSLRQSSNANCQEPSSNIPTPSDDSDKHMKCCVIV